VLLFNEQLAKYSAIKRSTEINLNNINIATLNNAISYWLKVTILVLARPLTSYITPFRLIDAGKSDGGLLIAVININIIKRILKIDRSVRLQNARQRYI